MKITEDFIGNETKELTKTKIATILRWWGFNPDSYSTWGNARVDMNNILSGSSSSTISDRERASSFLSKINYINDTDTVISDTLFAANEPGVWYDPSDLSTLFQDSAGTTPVTAVEQPVGLMLDKSKGLVLGPELVTNGDFSNGTTGWTGGGATLSVTDGVLRVTNSGAAAGSGFQTLGTVAGVTYRLTLTRVSAMGGGVRVTVNSGTSASYTGSLQNYNTPTGGSHTLVFTASSSQSTIAFYMNSSTAGHWIEVDNISVRELPGNHASQPTATSRPVLSARVNLLTKTEQFDNAVWTKWRSSIQTNVIAAPDGTLTASKLVENTQLGSHWVVLYQLNSHPNLTATVYLKAAERSRALLQLGGGASLATVQLNLGSGELGEIGVFGAAEVTAAGITPVGDGWYRVILAANGVSTGNQNLFAVYSQDENSASSYQGDGTSGIYIWGADLRVANAGANLPPYQRVNTATDYDTVGFPLYLRFDGVDDWLVTNTITPGVDKVQVFAGVRKLSDAAGFGMIAELGVAGVSGAGRFNIAAPATAGTATYFFGSGGTVFPLSGESAIASGYVSPITNVLAAVAEINQDVMRLRVNGTQAASRTADQGTGNFLAYPLYIGRRGGTSLPFNGHLYSLIVRFGSNLPDATIEKTEKYINGLTKAY